LETFACDGHTLTWEEHSSGEHTLLMLHGWSASRRWWWGLLAPLAGLGRCVTLDLPGHYPAQAPPDFQVTQEQLIDLETAAVRAICGERPVTLIGHSTGGLVSLGVAARLPGQVRRVICIDGVVWGPLSGPLGTAQWALARHLDPLFWASWGASQLADWAMMGGLTFYVADKLAHWRNPVAWEGCRRGWPWYRRTPLSNLAAMLRLLAVCDIRPLAVALPMPVLTITGDSDPLVPPEQSRWLADNLPCTDQVVLDKVGHMPHLEAPAALEKAIMSWLAEHPV
jgi:pimeloyl-ACP methyl ester carboxylesterase